MMGGGGGETLVGGAVSFGIALMVIVLMAFLAGVFLTEIPGAMQESTVLEPNGTAVVVDEDYREPTKYRTYYATDGTGVQLTSNAGDPTYVNASVGPLSSSWTACVSTALSDDATTAATYDVLALDNASAQLQFDGGDWLSYYSNGTHDAAVTAAAPSPTERTAVCARYDDSANELALFVDGAEQATGALDSGTESRNVAVSLDGTVDEVRVVATAVPDAALSGYASEPSKPLDVADSDRQARIMFDEESGTTSTVYYAGSEARLVNAGWTSSDAVPERVLPSGSYTVENGPWTLTLTGEWAAHPRVVVQYTNNPFAGAIMTIRSAGSAGFVISAIGLLSIPAVALVVLIYRTGGDYTSGMFGGMGR